MGLWVIFCPFTPALKILKKCEKFLEILSFYNVYQKPQSYEIRFLRYLLRQTGFFVILGNFFPFYPPLFQNFETMKKASEDVIILHMCTQKSHDVCFLRYGVRQI